MTDLAAGLSATTEHDVGADDTAIALGSGDLPVLATPRLVAWLEGAAVAAVVARLEPGSTTVGGHIAIDHLAPTAVGSRVRTEATVTTVAGRTIDFEISAREGDELIARGRHVRHVVDSDRFLARLSR